jgi:hypothetical protein
MLKHAALLACCGIISACTVVQVRGGSPSTSVHLGILKIEPAPEARSLSLRIRGFGVVPGISGATLGFAQEDVVVAYHAEDCRIVLFEPPLGSVDRQWLTTLLNNPNICRTGDSP